jgi:import inner membrane translocase subunit TIM50
MNATCRSFAIWASRGRNELTNSSNRIGGRLRSRQHKSSSSMSRPVKISQEERLRLRAARKERAAQMLAAVQNASKDGTTSAAAAGGSAVKEALKPKVSAQSVKYYWYAGFGIPTALIAWGIYDAESPPGKLAKFIGFTDLIHSFSDEFAKPARPKLLPDWSQMPNVPHDIPVPHTLILDLEQTLVSVSWDRKYGWRYAKRPGVDKFLQTLSQYYEIVLFSKATDGVAMPVVDSLDKQGCIMHKLFRDATRYKDGEHLKDLEAINRNISKIVVLDDDPRALSPEHRANLIKVKPYTDPHDRDDRTLQGLTPLLVEIAREGYNDVPSVLSQFVVEFDETKDGEDLSLLVIPGTDALGRKVRRMDADEMSQEFQRRIERMKEERIKIAQRGLGGFAGVGRAKSHTPLPEMPMEDFEDAVPAMLTSKDLVGPAPRQDADHQEGLGGWLMKRQKEKEEHQMRKMEKWNDIMMKKHLAKKEAAEKQQSQVM